jgi:hypothetical protein
MSVPEAVGRANATAGLSVLFAGITVGVAVASLQVAGIPMLTAMGWGTALMVAVTMVAAVSFLPGLLGLVGRRVNSLRMPFVRQRQIDPVDTRSGQWARRVVARPVRYGVVAAVLLGILAIPAFALRIGFADDGNAVPGSTLRSSYDLLADSFGPGVNGQLQVAVETKGNPDDTRALRDIRAAVADDRSVAAVSRPALSPAGDLAVLVVTPTTSPQDAETTTAGSAAAQRGTARRDAGAPRRDHGHRCARVPGGHLRRAAAPDAAVRQRGDRSVVSRPASQPAQQVDDLTTAEVRPEGDVSRDIGEAAVQPGGVKPRVAAQQRGLPGVPTKQPEQHPDRRRLAGAVRAEEAVHLAGGDREVQPVQRDRAPEGLAQPRHLDGVLHDLHASARLTAAAE